ncbi:Chordin Protein chordino [Collichthys lucidus]|uniref:Chordin n=1 Tax=Collichthys lucidus TaxID=240159 RepID=A0A4V6AQR1_COLLU|nr:Chordin Protein chordino [Collichthys lucidus]
MLSPRALRSLLCVLSCAWLHTGAASRLKSPALPIQSEREPLPSKGLSALFLSQDAHSEPDSTLWRTHGTQILGSPSAVMHCVQCYCEPQKGRRGKVFGKVNCKNIKQDCPDLDCDDPVLLPGHCCKTCPKGVDDKKQTDSVLDSFEYFHEKGKEKEDDLHKSYNDRSYLSSEEVGAGESRTDFVAVLTGVTDSWLPSSSGVARARFSLTRTSLAFSITYQKMSRPTRIIFLDSDGTTAFEYRVPKGQSDMICGVWKNLAKPLIRQLQSEQMRISMTTSTSRREEVEGKIIKHRALFAETFSSTLTSEEENAGMGGIAMLTLSDTENNLHFILILQGLIKHKDKDPPVVPIRVQLVYRQHILREIRANVTAHLTTLRHDKKNGWSGRVSGENKRREKVCERSFRRRQIKPDTVIALHDLHKTPLYPFAPYIPLVILPVQFPLHKSPSLCPALSPFPLYFGSSLCGFMDPDFAEVLTDLNSRELFWLSRGQLEIAVATEGQDPRQISGFITGRKSCDTIQSVMSSGDALTPGKTGGVGSAVFYLHDNGTLDYQVQVAGLTSDFLGLTIELKPRRRNKRSVLYDLTPEYVKATGQAQGSWSRLEARHIHMLLQNELFINVATAHSQEGELRGQIKARHYNGLETPRYDLPTPLAGQFVSPPAQGVLKDISVELLQHLDQGTAFIQVSTKMNPRGEIRGRVHVPNNCEFGTRGDMEGAEFDDLFVKDPEELKKDPHTCFFENQHHAHGSRWTPNYDKCFSCSCQKRTVICDPVICPVLTCSRTIQPEDKCCPICDERKEPKDMKALERVDEHLEGCYFEGDQKMHAPGTTWHPFVPPFGYIKCAVCTCKGSSGEVHCEKVTCPVLTCSHPVRRNPSDCCKECPEEDRTSAGLEHSDMMQADGPRHCKFGKNYYQNSDNWHPWVPLVGEMKCINCWCDHGVTKCQRKQCPILTCSNITRREGSCCPECLVQRGRRSDDESSRQKTDLETLICEGATQTSTNPNLPIEPILMDPNPELHTGFPPLLTSPDTHPVVSFRIVMNREEQRRRNNKMKT